MSGPVIEVEDLSKAFTLHQQGGAVIEALRGASLEVRAGECVGLVGPSGAGKSSLMRVIQGNYRAGGGAVRVAGLDVARAAPREVMALRRTTLGHVGQFLRVVPRVPCVEVVAEPARLAGAEPRAARAAAEALLERLNLPRTLWPLSPTTFSGGEQQRVGVARGFVHPFPALLLDEPTASLDPANRDVVLALIAEAKARGAAILGIFHDADVRARACDREVRLEPAAAAA